MPWEVKQNGDKHCVYKIGSSTPIKGGCHSTRQKAVAHQRALYANYKKEARMGEISNALAFTEKAVAGDDGLLWLEALPAKTWFDPRWGEVPITREKLDNFVTNFNENVRGQEITTDYEHGIDPAKGKKASGTYRKLDIRPRDDGTVSLWAGIEPTSTAASEIKNKEWKYFSLEWEDEWIHPETQETHTDVITGGGFTNRPVAKGMLPINFSEVFIEAEHAPEYTQEPGTGTVDPEVNKDDSFPNRIDTPPPGEDGTVEPRPVTSPNPTDREGGEVMTDEQLLELRKLLGVAEDADGDAIVTATREFSEELEPLRELQKRVEAKKKFAEEYPAEAAKLEQLETRDQERLARTFSEDFATARIKKVTTEGEGDEAKTTEEPTTLGFSGLVVNEIEKMAKQFSEGTPTLEGFRGVLDSVLANGIVDYGNKGSERVPDPIEGEGVIPQAGSAEARRMFAEKVEEVMKKDELEYGVAVAEAAKQYPKLAEAYRQPPVVA